MDTYFRLRQILFDSWAFDSIRSTVDLAPFFERLDKGEGVFKVIRDYVKTIDTNRNWTVRVGNESYVVRIYKKIAGESSSKIPKEKSQAKLIAKRILICLANLENILKDGIKTRFIPNDNRKNINGVIRHEGWRWIYVREFIEEPGLEGGVIVQLGFPNPEKTSSNPNNMIYNTATSGMSFYEKRAQQFEKFKAAEAEVAITLNV